MRRKDSQFGQELIKYSVLSRELVKRQQQFNDQVTSIIQMPMNVIIAGEGPSELRTQVARIKKKDEE